MHASALVLVFTVAAPVAGAPAPLAVASVPDEPGSVVLPDASILQSVAADVDLDGSRDLVRLVGTAEDGVEAEVWSAREEGWELLGDSVQVVPPSRDGPRVDPVYSATPVRLLVRRVDGIERVTVASQPHFEEIDVGPPCCLLLHDIAVADGVARRVEVATPSDFADSVLVIDLDGDGTDELLATKNLPPAGDIGYPIEARVHRWTGDAFAPPTVSPLPVGSGDTPIHLGDSDGVAGDEAAIISTLGPPGLFRIRLAQGDRLVVDAAGFVADQALAVPVGDRRGVAVVGPVVGLMVAEWPAGAQVAVPIAESFLSDVRMVGTVVVREQARLVVDQPSTGALHMLGLPGLLPPQGITITRSPAAAALATSPLSPYSGPLPGGGVDGAAAVIHHGRLIPSVPAADATGTAVMATLAGAEPIGLVGERDRLAIHHAPIGPPASGPGGGALTVPGPVPLGWTSIVPFDLARTPESDDGTLDASLRGTVRLDARNGVATGPAGFIAQVTAPPGSRLVAADFDPSVAQAAVVVPASGRAEVPFTVPVVSTPNPRYRALLVVATPAGHAYLASWEVRVRTAPPAVEVEASTPFGSSSVEIAGRADPRTVVRIDGRTIPVGGDGHFSVVIDLPPWPTDVRVEADDTLGNVTRMTVTGVGLFDYRQLPWVPIVIGLVAVAGIALFLRVPRSAPLAPRAADDDAAFEELEPD